MSDKSEANALFKQALAFAKRGRWFLAELAVNKAERCGGITAKQRARLQEAKHRSRFAHNPILDSIEASHVAIRLRPYRVQEGWRKAVQLPKNHGRTYYTEQIADVRERIAEATGVPERMLR